MGTLPGALTVTLQGTANYSIPITCPKGTAGMQPTVSLDYSSDGSTGAAGMGWMLSGIPTVTRGPKTLDRDGLVRGPVLDASDGLYFSGSRLIPVRNDAPDEVEYRTDVDSYQKIIGYDFDDYGPTRFSVWTKAGLRLDLGGIANARITTSDGRILVWACDRMVDTLDNEIRYEYVSNQSGDWNVAAIYYTANSNAKLLPYASVEFEYEQISPATTYLLGRQIVKDQRLKRIVSKYRDEVVREYRLTFTDTIAHSRFRLTEVQEVGGDGRTFPPTRFSYTTSEYGWTEQVNLAPPISFSDASVAGRGVRYLDFDGDGDADLLFALQTSAGPAKAYAYKSDAGGWKPAEQFAPPTPFASAGGDLGVRFFDLNADQRIDLVFDRVTAGTREQGSWLNSTDGWISEPNFRSPVPFAFDGVPNEGVIEVDLDGDDRKDLVWSYEQPDGTWVRGAALSTPNGLVNAPEFLPPIAFVREGERQGRAYVVDADCDGHADIMIHRPTRGESRLLRWETEGWNPAPSDDALLFPFEAPRNAKGIRTIDLNGDGYLDVLVGWSDGEHEQRAAFLATQDGWKESPAFKPQVWFAYGDEQDLNVATADVDGDKRDDLVGWSALPDGTEQVFAFRNTGSTWEADYRFRPRARMSDWRNASQVGVVPSFLVDINGDGRADLAHHGERVGQVEGAAVFLSNADGYNHSPAEDYAPPSRIAVVEQLDRGARFVDFNGDGLVDMIFRFTTEAGKVESAAWRNTAHGWESAPEFELPNPTATEKGGEWGTKFSDVNGDGLVDCIVGRESRLGVAEKKVYLNRGSGDPRANGSAWETSGIALPLAFVREEYGDLGVRLVDLNADGLPDVLKGVFRRTETKPPPPGAPPGTAPTVVPIFEREAWLNTGSGWSRAANYDPPIDFVADFQAMPDSTPNEWRVPRQNVAEVRKLHSRDQSVLVADVNGDKLPDIVFHFEYKGIIYTDQGKFTKFQRTREIKKGAFLNTGSGWMPAPESYVPPRRLDAGDDNRRLHLEITDVNGDGLIDLMFIERNGANNASTTWIGTGGGWSELAEWKAPDAVPSGQEGDQGVRVVDVTGDGLVDLLVRRANPDNSETLLTYVNDGHTWQAVVMPSRDRDPLPVFARPKQGDLGIRLLDVNGDGLPDFVQSRDKADGAREIRNAWLNANRRRDLLVRVVNGVGVTHEIRYHALSDPYEDDFYALGELDSYPMLRAAPPAYAVRTLQVREPAHAPIETHYAYSGFKVNLRTGQPLGFRTWRAWQPGTNHEERVTIHQGAGIGAGSNALAGRIEAREIKVLSRTYSTQKNIWRVSTRDALQNDTGTRWQIHVVQLAQTVSAEWDLDGTPIRELRSEFEFDEFGNGTTLSIFRGDGSGVRTVSEFRNDATKWILGRMLSSRSESFLPGGAPITRVAKFEFDPQTGLLTAETSLAGTSQQVVTRYTHDAFGNRVKVTKEAAGAQPRTLNFEYDAEGRFTKTQIDALGHMLRMDFHPGLSEVVRQTDANGIGSTRQFDSLGRLISIADATGMVTRLQYLPLAADDDAAELGAVSRVATTVGALPPVVTYVDARERTVRTRQPGADGTAILIDTRFDNRGRSIGGTLPYFEGTTPLWSSVRYDAFDRPTEVASPDGAKSAMKYHGRVTERTDRNGRTTITTRDERDNKLAVEDALGGVTRYTYDALGRRIRTDSPGGAYAEREYNDGDSIIAASDADQGRRVFVHNGFGELVRETDALNRITEIDYDALGRPVERRESDRITRWTYDAAPHGKGALAKVEVSNGCAETFSYDAFGRVEVHHVTVSGAEFETRNSYDEYGRTSVLTYPSGFAVRNIYNSQGVLYEVLNAHTDELFWRGKRFNAKGQVIEEETGNGVSSRHQFEERTGFLTSTITRGHTGAEIQQWEYGYDAEGNVRSRSEGVRGMREEFGYDALERLVQVRTATNVLHIGYDAGGNIMRRSDLGEFDYGSGAAPHGVKQVGRAGLARTYHYDAAGNVTGIDGMDIEYTGANLPSRIVDRRTWSEFVYSAGGARMLHRAQQGLRRWETVQIGLYEHINEEMVPPFGRVTDWMTGWNYRPVEPVALNLADLRLSANERLRHRHYITAGPAGVVAVHEDLTEFYPVRHHARASAAAWADPLERSQRRMVQCFYLHRDALRSITAVTDAAGAVVELLSYDPWGRRTGTGEPGRHHTLARGFTGHEHLDHLGLIHMNGRLFDPNVGRFMSADPFEDAAIDTQQLNRYAYVSNNPLRYVDPSGFGFFRSIGRAFSDVGRAIGRAIGGVTDAAKKIGGWIYDAHKAVGRWIEDNWKTIVVVAVVVAVGVLAAPLGPVVAGMLAGAAGGALSAGIATNWNGDAMLQGALIGAATGMATGMASSVASTMTSAYAKAAVYGTAGTWKAGFTGGDAGKGFLAGAFASGFAQEYANSFENSGSRLLVSAAAGGTESVIGGGKFENGALTGAFAQLSLREVHSSDWAKSGSTWATAAKWAVQTIGYIRALPATIGGIIAGAAIGASGGTFGNNGIEFRKEIGDPAKGGAFTIGNAIIYVNAKPDDSTVHYHGSTASGFTLGEHEAVHTRQWGAYGAKGFLERYRDAGFAMPHTDSFNYLEAQADDLAK